MRWDNITILQAVDRHQERSVAASFGVSTAAQLMEEIAARK